MDIHLQFDSSFYEEEERCGYTITPKLKKIWAVELDLLSEFERVCRKNNLHYSAFSGTLLGAVRHKGFIPWDDDLDVCMLREDFDKLVKIANDEFSYPYFFQTALTDKKFFCGYARLRNSSTCGIITTQKSPDYNGGIFIDIYVLDNRIENEKKLEKQIVDLSRLARKLRAFNGDVTSRTGLKSVGFALLKAYDHIFWNYEDMVQKYYTLLQKYNGQSSYCSMLTHNLSVVKRSTCRIEDIKDCIYQKYENIYIPIPRNYDKMLTHKYGDYMEFPPVEKRGVWHNDIIEFDPDISYLKYFNKS